MDGARAVIRDVEAQVTEVITESCARGVVSEIDEQFWVPDAPADNGAREGGSALARALRVPEEAVADSVAGHIDDSD